MLQSELITQHEATTKSWKRLQRNRNRDMGLYGVDCGIHSLNLLIGGWIETKVTTIGARSGVGKTAIITPIVKAGARVQGGRRAEFLLFTWETESSYLVDRYICHEIGITRRMLHQGAKLIGKKTLDSIKEIYADSSKLPVIYQEMSTNIDVVSGLVLEFVKSCRKKEQIEGVGIQPVIMIDYIGMADFSGSGLRTYGIGDFMNGCKKLANETSASFCIFAQIKRSADDKDMPERNDFADSQSIEMASDNLILLHRPEHNNIKVIQDPDTGATVDSTNKLLIRVLKARDFGTGDKLINCNIKYDRFWDLSHDRWDYPYYNLYSDKDFWINELNLG